ncbi:MAG: radical domain protein [Clostridia bacterium]|jgi:7-carboxy-7-deazaguanine synthase|nr:radical domain protein [Clostridia bacterium]
MKYKVAEKFVSVNGEGLRSGELAVFIRLAGCNLNCSYCDTAWANEADTIYKIMAEEDIYTYIKSTKVTNVTLTGGEPLLADGITILLKKLAGDKDLSVEIETNGSILLDQFIKIENRPSFTMDYKLPSSGMEKVMLTDNFKYLTKQDTVKFVCGTKEDLQKAKFIIDQFQLTGKTNIYISPVFGKIDMAYIVDFMKDQEMNGVRLQVQLHKIIWDHNKRGV